MYFYLLMHVHTPTQTQTPHTHTHTHTHACTYSPTYVHNLHWYYSWYVHLPVYGLESRSLTLRALVFSAVQETCDENVSALCLLSRLGTLTERLEERLCASDALYSSLLRLEHLNHTQQPGDLRLPPLLSGASSYRKSCFPAIFPMPLRSLPVVRQCYQMKKLLRSCLGARCRWLTGLPVGRALILTC